MLCIYTWPETVKNVCFPKKSSSSVKPWLLIFSSLASPVGSFFFASIILVVVLEHDSLLLLLWLWLGRLSVGKVVTRNISPAPSQSMSPYMYIIATMRNSPSLREKMLRFQCNKYYMCNTNTDNTRNYTTYTTILIILHLTAVHYATLYITL